MPEDLTQGQMFIIEWQYRSIGDFKKALIELMCLADDRNLERIAKGYPVEARAYTCYKSQEDWWQSTQEQAMELGIIPKGAF